MTIDAYHNKPSSFIDLSNVELPVFPPGSRAIMHGLRSRSKRQIMITDCSWNLMQPVTLISNIKVNVICVFSTIREKLNSQWENTIFDEHVLSVYS